MKKFFIILFMLGILTACENTKSSDIVGEISDYVPIEDNVSYEYEVKGLTSEITRSVYNAYTADDRVQRYVTTTGMLDGVEVVQVSTEEARMVFGESANYYFENIINANNSEKDIVILKAPLKTGTSWNDAMGTSTITNTSVSVETPSGTYDALEVTTTLNVSGFEEKYYYAKGVGLVKSVHQNNGLETQVILSSFVKDTGVLVPVYVYYPNIETGQLDIYEESITMLTNDTLIKSLLEVMKKAPTENHSPLLSSKTYAQDLQIDRLNKNIHLDFTSNYGEGLQMGEGIHSDVLKGIVNTIGNFYDTESISLSIDGKPFEYLGILLEDKEKLPVDSLNFLNDKIYQY